MDLGKIFMDTDTSDDANPAPESVELMEDAVVKFIRTVVFGRL